MKAKLMCSFAAGLFVATSMCGAVYFFDPSEVISTETTQVMSEEEMKDKLTSSGYVIHSEKEWEEELARVKPVEQVKPVEPIQDPTQEIKEKVVYQTVLNVASGMTSIDVGNALVKGKIIEDAMSFFNEVEKKGLSSKLRPGTYELTSEMSVDEVMAMVFK